MSSDTRRRKKKKSITSDGAFQNKCLSYDVPCSAWTWSHPCRSLTLINPLAWAISRCRDAAALHGVSACSVLMFSRLCCMYSNYHKCYFLLLHLQSCKIHRACDVNQEGLRGVVFSVSCHQPIITGLRRRVLYSHVRYFLRGVKRLEKVGRHGKRRGGAIHFGSQGQEHEKFWCRNLCTDKWDNPSPLFSASLIYGPIF